MFTAWAFCLVFFVSSHHSDSAKEGAEVACSSAPFHLVASQGLDISQSAKTPTTSETTICSSLSRSNVSCGTLGIQPWTRRNGQLTVEVLGVQTAHQDEGGILSKLRGGAGQLSQILRMQGRTYLINPQGGRNHRDLPEGHHGINGQTHGINSNGRSFEQRALEEAKDLSRARRMEKMARERSKESHRSLLGHHPALP